MYANPAALLHQQFLKLQSLMQWQNTKQHARVAALLQWQFHILLN
jgi:hypothetical protein